MAEVMLWGWLFREVWMMIRKEGSLNHMVSRQKGLGLRGWEGGRLVLRRIRWWSEKVLRRCQSLDLLKRSFHWGLERTLSRRFITKPLSLLLVQVNLGPLKFRSSKLQLFRKSLKMDICLQLGGELLRPLWCARISLKSPASTQGREWELAKEVRSSKGWYRS